MDCRTDLRVYVRDCPDNQRAAAAGYFRQGPRDFEVDWSDPVPAQLEMDRPYTLSDAPLGTLKEVTTGLRQAAPGVSFTAWADPDSEGLGELIAFTPEFGEYTSCCDAGGDPVFTLDQVTKVIEDAAAGTGRDAAHKIKNAIYQAMGGPWLDHAEERTQPPGPGNAAR